jgi:hypothetical protein
VQRDGQPVRVLGTVAAPRAAAPPAEGKGAAGPPDGKDGASPKR